MREGRGYVHGEEALAKVPRRDQELKLCCRKENKGHFFRYLEMISIRSSYQLDVGGKE